MIQFMTQSHKAVTAIYHRTNLLGSSDSQELSEAVADDHGPSDTLSEKVTRTIELLVTTIGGLVSNLTYKIFSFCFVFA